MCRLGRSVGRGGPRRSRGKENPGRHRQRLQAAPVGQRGQKELIIDFFKKS